MHSVPVATVGLSVSESRRQKSDAICTHPVSGMANRSG